mmetsp:Transcript_5168/g.7765  ORF Transcript_5168/g.7765 Transcript_5168/m.7765 type:complete len:125 (+) Transcript_5168:200-574(+)
MGKHCSKQKPKQHFDDFQISFSDTETYPSNSLPDRPKYFSKLNKKRLKKLYIDTDQVEKDNCRGPKRTKKLNLGSFSDEETSVGRINTSKPKWQHQMGSKMPKNATLALRNLKIREKGVFKKNN